MVILLIGVSVFGYDFKAIYGKENEHFNDYYKIVNFAFKFSNLIRGVVRRRGINMVCIYWSPI